MFPPTSILVIIMWTFEKHWSPAFSCRFFYHLVIIIKNFAFLCGTFGKKWPLCDHKGQPNCQSPPFFRAGSQTGMGPIQWICVDQQKLHSDRHRCSTGMAGEKINITLGNWVLLLFFSAKFFEHLFMFSILFFDLICLFLAPFFEENFIR